MPLCSEGSQTQPELHHVIVRCSEANARAAVVSAQVRIPSNSVTAMITQTQRGMQLSC